MLFSTGGQRSPAHYRPAVCEGTLAYCVARKCVLVAGPAPRGEARQGWVAHLVLLDGRALLPVEAVVRDAGVDEVDVRPREAGVHEGGEDRPGGEDEAHVPEPRALGVDPVGVFVEVGLGQLARVPRRFHERPSAVFSGLSSAARPLAGSALGDEQARLLRRGRGCPGEGCPSWKLW